MVSLDILAPPDRRERWRAVVDQLLTPTLASLHSFDPAEVRAWLARVRPEVVESIVARLARPGPLGPARLVRSKNGRVTDLPHRADRVAAMRVTITDSDAWVVRARVSTARSAWEN